MSLQLKIDVKNNASKELVRFQKDLKQLDISIPKTSNNFSMLSKSMVALGASAYALNKTYSATIKRGLEYNNLIENQRNSIATLINVTSKNIDSQGKSLTYQEKMNLSLANSNELMAELTRINANTPQTLGQTAQIFKTMYAPMQKVGASQKDLIYLTEKLAIASKVGGVEFNSLLAGVDGLASGTVLANSDLGRFLSSLGLTNEAIKESNDVIGLLKTKLKDFKAFDDLDTSVSNLNVQWDTLTGNMTKDIYSAQKIYTKQLTGFLKTLNDEYKDYEQNIKRVADISKLKNTQDLTREIQQLKDKNEALKKIGAFSKYWKYASDSAYKQDIKNNAFLIKQAEKRLKLLKEEKSLKSEPSLVSKKTDTASISPSSASLEQKLNIDKEYYIKLGELEKAWNIEAKQLSDRYGKDRFAKLYETSKVEFFDKFKKETKQIETVELKEFKFDNTLLDSIKNFKKDIQKEINTEPFTFKIELDTSNFSDADKDILKVSSGFETLAKEQSSYNEAISQTGLTQQQINEMNEQHNANQIQGYANLAGAMSKTFKDGSNEAKAMIVVQTALSVATAMVAIASAGTGDPYTAIARVVAMIATLRSAGIALSGGSASAPKDYSSTIESANYTTGTGVSLGDYDNSFDDFIKGLDKASERLEDFGSVGSATKNELEILTNQLSSAQTDNNVLSQFDDDVFSLIVAKNSGIIDKTTNEISRLLIDNIADSLTFEGLSENQLEHLIGDFDASSYEETLSQINDLAITAKQHGGNLTSKEQKELIEFYTLPNFVKGQDYQGAIEALEKLNDAMFDMTKTANKYELSFSGLEDTTDLRKAQIEEEKAFLIKEIPELSKVTKDNFVSLYEDIDPTNTDLIDSYEEYGDLLVEQASLIDDVSSSLADLNKNMITSANQYEITFASFTKNEKELSDLRASQIQEEMEYLSSSFGDVDLIDNNITKDIKIFGHKIGSFTIPQLETLSDVTVDNFQEIYEAIDPTNTDLIEAMQEYGNLLAEQAQIEYDATKAIEDNKLSLEQRLELLNATDEADKLAIERGWELEELNDDANKALLQSIFNKEDELKAIEDATKANEDFIESMQRFGESIDDAINTIKGNLLKDSQDTTSELIRQYNTAINKGEYDTASNLATQISSTAFGDTSNLDRNLIASLEQTKMDIGFEDEILNVNIVSSDLNLDNTTTTPSVLVANQSVTSNDTMETILMELLKTNKRVETILERIEENQEL